MIGTYKTLLSDCFSFVKSKIIYAKKGEKVKVISISEPAVIVENITGNKFPTTINNLI